MRKRIFLTTCIIAVLLLSLSIIGSAGEGFFVNSAAAVLESLNSSYAVGSDGVQLVGRELAYAMTSSGIQQIGSPSTDGGGGLVYTDGNVKIKSDTVRVGLRYYYSDSRNSGMTSANLENCVGSGYSFGVINENGEYLEMARTEETRITMRPIGNGVGVYTTGTDTLLYSQEFTNKNNYLTVVPICEDGDSITWFAGNKYYGWFDYAVLGGGKLTVVNVVELEKYVMGVCSMEMSEQWPVEALKAQALAARTYAQSYIRNSTYYYTCGFDVTGDTYCQAYSGCTNVGANIRSAVTSTENQYITYDGRLISAVYFSSDGGATESNENVYGNSGHPYLKGVFDPYEAAADSENYFSSWETSLTNRQLAAKVGLDDIASYEITRSETGNVIQIVFTASNGQSYTVSRSGCRTKLGLNSIRYDITVDADGKFVFTGSGWGHNLGMSQFGAYAMAKYYSKTYEDILGFYYTKVGLSYGVLE